MAAYHCRRRTAMNSQRPVRQIEAVGVTGGAGRSGMMRIEAAAQRTGLTPRSLRYWEELGLVTPSGRSPSGHRLYTETDLARLEKIKQLRDTIGLSLAEIQQLLEAEAVRDRVRERYRASPPAERAALLRQAIEQVGAQLEVIARKRKALADLQVEYEDRVARLRRALAELETELAKPC
jgi:DNA-binding transcriptional MerR regulator